MPRPILATIDTQALANNLQQVRAGLQTPAALAQVAIWAVIKARGYGHGIDATVQAFASADGLAMLDFDEAVRVRELGWRGPILLLEGFFQPQDIALLQRYDLSIGIHSNEQLAMLEAAEVKQPINAFIKLNSGMHRLGFQPAEFLCAFARAQQLQKHGVLGELGKMTHLARADESLSASLQQLKIFQQLTSGLPGSVSVCNSAASLRPGFAAELRGQPQWVRPGICLYGSSPFADKSAQDLGLEPGMTLSSELISTHWVPAGAGVGYGHIFHAPQKMRIGIVACGYADGYPRHAATDTPITVAGVRTRLVGRVSMDMLAVDLSMLPDAQVGAPVVLWGRDGPSVDEVAAAAGTIGYELLTALSARVPRKLI